jgi:hypothetical protein
MSLVNILRDMICEAFVATFRATKKEQFSPYDLARYDGVVAAAFDDPAMADVARKLSNDYHMSLRMAEFARQAYGLGSKSESHGGSNTTRIQGQENTSSGVGN